MMHGKAERGTRAILTQCQPVRMAVVTALSLLLGVHTRPWRTLLPVDRRVKYPSTIRKVRCIILVQS